MDSLTASPSLPNTAQKRPLSDDGTSEVENAAPDGTEPTKEGQEELSKRARKRLLKAAKWEATKDERKRQKKEKDKIREQKKKEERAKLLAEGADPAIFKRRPDVQLPSNAKIVIDCDFNDLMTEKELQSMAKQLSFCYSKNRLAKHPMKIFSVNFKGKLEAAMDHKQPHWRKWKMKFDPASYLDIFAEDRSKIVYLTADSPNVIEDVEEDKIYVIGGIIDRNRHKMLCYNRAVEHGVAHGRLKIDQYIKMKGRAILTVDQVFEIMSKYLESRSWEESFWSVIPKRKELAAVGGKGGEGNDNESPSNEGSQDDRPDNDDPEDFVV